jgi:RNA polymerase sigma-70 factor (ECF subfamily)
VLRNIDRFDPRFRFSTWLFTIARRLLVNHQQKLRPESEGDGVASWASDEPRPEDLIVEAERQDHVRRIIDVAVSCLNPIQRELVTLFHDRAWTIEALSRHFSLPEGTIKSHLFRARKRMQEAITRDESLARQAKEVLK